MMRFFKSALPFCAATLSAGAVFAQENLGALESIGKPIKDGIGFQPAATTLATQLRSFDTFLLYIITAILVFVTILILWAGWRYNIKRNPNPATFTHNTKLEMTWTVVPILILLVISVPSLKLLNNQQKIPQADVVVKAIGNQWYWTHEYPEHEFGFDSIMLARDELAKYGYAPDEYLLATDNAVVVPINKNIVVRVTASDVIHSWAIPSFGVKQDGVPGRTAELWFNIEKEGVYFGQCSELCGKDHSYMPITVKAVSQEKYEAWLDSAIKEYAGKPRQVIVAGAK